MKSARIAGLGKYLPPDVLTNADLERMVDTSDEWITERCGIKTRHIAAKGVPCSQLAYHASLQALKRAGLKPEEVELIIVATVTPDMPFPSTACHLQRLLHARDAACFDITAACAGFIYGITNAWNFLRTGMYKNALVVGSEVLSAFTDWKDRGTCVLFGDGAGAAVLVPSQKDGIMSADMGADGSDPSLLSLPGGGSLNPPSEKTLIEKMHYIKMKGNELFRIAVRIMVDTAKKALKKAGLTAKDVNILVPHQANIRIINAVSKRLGLKEEQVYVNIHRYGNMSAACSAIALCEAWEDKKIKKGDIVLLDAFGGGLVWGSNVIKWA